MEISVFLYLNKLISAPSCSTSLSVLASVRGDPGDLWTPAALVLHRLWRTVSLTLGYETLKHSKAPDPLISNTETVLHQVGQGSVRETEITQDQISVHIHWQIEAVTQSSGCDSFLKLKSFTAPWSGRTAPIWLVQTLSPTSGTETSSFCSSKHVSPGNNCLAPCSEKGPLGKRDSKPLWDD